MNCDEFERRLWGDRETGSLSIDAPELLGHASHCPACLAEWERAQLLSDAIVDWRERIPEVDLIDAVLAARRAGSDQLAVKRQPVRTFAWSAAPEFQRTARTVRSLAIVPGRSGLRQSRRALWMGIAGLAALSAVGLLTPSPRSDESPFPLEFAQGPMATGLSGSAGTAERGTLVTSTSDVYSKLAETAAGALGQVSQFVIPGTRRPMSAHERVSVESSSWIDEFPYQLGPIRRSVGDAFDFLWKAGDAQRDSRS